MQKTRRLILLLPGGFALLLGLDAALLLLGLPAPLTTERLPDIHGVLLVLGFVGTLVAAERAVALRRWWGFSAPIALGAGAIALVSPAPLEVGKGLFLTGTIAMLAVFAALWRRQPSVAIAIQVLGTGTGAGAAALWLGGTPVATTLPWLAAFLVLTIAGERVELSRVDGVTPAQEDRALVASWFLVSAVVAATLWPAVGHVLLGAALLVLVGWLVSHDVARRTVRATGAPRFMAWCLIGGYVWLTVAGFVWLLLGHVPEGAAYDAVVHAVFLGFVLSMIMAHASVILPAVLRTPLPYRPAFYVPVVLLHASLALRIVVGDLRGQEWALQVGGALNIAAVLLFVVLAVGSAVLAARSGGRPAPREKADDASPPVDERSTVSLLPSTLESAR